MTENILKVPFGENISFTLLITSDEEELVLPDGYEYYFRVSDSLEGERLIDVTSGSVSFEIENNLPCGSYYFEIGMTNGSNDIVICSPVDEKMKKINELVITRRL